MLWDGKDIVWLDPFWRCQNGDSGNLNWLPSSHQVFSLSLMLYQRGISKVS